MSAKYKSPSFLLPNELNTSANTANDTGINSLYSMDFDGSSQYIDVNYSLNGINSISYSAWIKPEQPSGNYGYILTAGDYSYTDRMLSIGVRQSNRKIFVYGGRSSGGIKEFNFTVTYGTWYHIAIVYTNNQDVDLYVNGNPEGSIQFNDTSSIASGSPTKIGVYSGTLGNYFKGQIDEVAIFNRALDTTEIAALYGGTSPNIYPSNLMASNLGPIAYYPLGEQAQNSGYPSASGNEWQFPNGVLQDYVMDFDGNNQYINAGVISDLSNVSEYSISLWANIDTGASGTLRLFGNRESSSPFNGIGADIDLSASLYFYLNGGPSYPVVQVANISNYVTAGTWFNLICTFNAGQAYIFINGIQRGSGTGSSTADTTTNPLYIGADPINTNSYFDGQISNLAIWNSDQATNKDNIYNNGSPQTSYTVTPQNWWKLNADSVYTPSAPNYTTALDFNGSSDYIDITQSSTLPPNSGDFTYSTWVNIDPSTSISIIVLLNKGDAWPGNGILIRYRSYFEVLINGVVYGFTGLTAVDGPGVWRHFALVFDETANTLTAYVDTNKEVKSATTTLNVSDANFIIGKRQNNIQYFKGQMSNIAVYSSALTDSQISTLFNFGTPETTPSFSPTAWWKLDDQNAITDYSGNGHTGTNNGATNSPGGVAYTPSWKIPSELPIQTPSYTQALDFNNGSGNTDSIAYGSSFSDVPSASGAHTFSLWFKQEALNSNGERLFATKAGHGAFSIFITNGTLQWAVYDGGPRVVSTSIQAGVWYNIIFGLNGSNEIFLYLNNGSKISTAYSGTIIYSSSMSETGIYLGRGRDATSNRSFNGQLSNFAWFNYVLPETGAESIESIYNLGTPKDITGWSNSYLWYKLNSLTITDSSGNNRTGTNNNATLVSSDVLATQPVNGVSTTLPSTALQQSDLQFDSPYSNYSLKFSTSQRVDTNFTLPASYTSYSYSIWYKQIGTISGDNYVVGNLDNSASGTAQNRAAFRFNNGTWRIRIIGGDNTNQYYLQYSDVPSNILDGNWHHIAVTVINGEILLYIDSIKQTPAQVFGTPVTGVEANGNYMLGYSGNTGNPGYLKNSLLDEFAIFDKKLTEAEILSIYNNGKPGDISPIAPTNWWRLGENAYFVNNDITLPNSIAGAPNGVSSGTATSMLTADAPGTYANGIGDGLAITDRVGDAPLSVANSQSYNMIPDDKVPYVPGYIGAQINNVYSMTFDGVDDYFDTGQIDITGTKTISFWVNVPSSGNNGGIFTMGDSSSSERLSIGLWGSNITACFSLSLKNRAVYTINNNTWYHVVIVKSTFSIDYIYINGVSQTIDNNTGWQTPIAVTSVIGYLHPNFYFTGSIDEFAIFDEALTADQVKFDLYEPTALVGGVEKTADIENNTNLPTPLAWYRMGD